MKKKINFKKVSISKLDRDANPNKVVGGVQTGDPCLRNSKWCEFSELASCYSPCGPPHGTKGC
jgi:hypothetical protein